ncbi:helix-turn-helix domain-containing protein [Gemmata sp.]|uniref:helix-turn-helix domain-containing protein n=1 Tax=Gemmata sp. TaxID=1914242 RepID=UPI003F6EF60B
MADLTAALGPVLDRLEVIVARLDRAGPAHGTHLTVTELARNVGRSEYRVRAWIKEGRIAATKVAGIPRSRWLIARSELHRLLGSGATAK